MFKILINPLRKRRKMKLKEIKEILLKNKQEIEEQLSKLSNTNSNGDIPSSAGFGRNEDIDPDTEADIFEEIGNNLAMYQVLEKELSKVNEALERINDGTYGDCAGCNKPIRLMRLKVSPSARYCGKCIKQREGK